VRARPIRATQIRGSRNFTEPPPAHGHPNRDWRVHRTPAHQGERPVEQADVTLMTDLRQKLHRLSGTATPGSLWRVAKGEWKQALFSAWREASDDNIGLVAAGVAFYGFLAIVPLLGIIVLVYGFAADPGDVGRDIQTIMAIVPADTAHLVSDLLANVVHASEGRKGFGLVVAAGVALYGGMNGASAVVTALNIAYEQEERRSFVRVELLALAITAIAILLTITALLVIAIVTQIGSLFPEAAPATIIAGRIVSLFGVTAVGAAGAATLYRYGPDHKNARWIWVTPGSAFASMAWVLIAIGFGAYVKSFGDYNATYGSIGAVIVTLTWIYLSAYALLLGAEINAELQQRLTPAVAAPVNKESLSDKPGEQAVEPPRAEPSQPALSMANDLIVGQVSARAVHFIGLEKAPALPSILGTAGIALLRRKGRARYGIALLAAGGAIAWLGRRSPVDG
jgi:membrane protein